MRAASLTQRSKLCARKRYNLASVSVISMWLSTVGWTFIADLLFLFIQSDDLLYPALPGCFVVVESTPIGIGSVSFCMDILSSCMAVATSCSVDPNRSAMTLIACRI